MSKQVLNGHKQIDFDYVFSIFFINPQFLWPDFKEMFEKNSKNPELIQKICGNAELVGTPCT